MTANAPASASQPTAQNPTITVPNNGISFMTRPKQKEQVATPTSAAATPASTAPAMADPNFAPQMKVGAFSNKMSDYGTAKPVANPTGSDTPLMDANQKTFFDMPKSPTTPDGYEWNDAALQQYGFEGSELNRVKTADFSNPDTVNYYVSQGWLNNKAPQSIEEVLATPATGSGSSSSAPDIDFTPAPVAQPANANPAADAAPQDAAAPDSGNAPSSDITHEDVLAEMKRRHGEDIVNSPYYGGIYDNVYNDLKSSPITFGQGQLDPFM